MLHDKKTPPQWDAHAPQLEDGWEACAQRRRLSAANKYTAHQAPVAAAVFRASQERLDFQGHEDPLLCLLTTTL